MADSTVATYDYRTKHHYSEPEWICRICDHATRYMTIALFHQHDAHKTPMHELEVRNDLMMRRTDK